MEMRTISAMPRCAPRHISATLTGPPALALMPDDGELLFIGVALLSNLFTS
jgi:hypothetical protein